MACTWLFELLLYGNALFCCCCLLDVVIDSSEVGFLWLLFVCGIALICDCFV